MHDEHKEILRAAGIDYEAALERFMNNETLLRRFLLKFLSDSNYETLEKALQSGDIDAAFRAAHTLKGVAGNLSMTLLFQALTEQSNLLREKDIDGARAFQPRIEKLYADIKKALISLENM